MANQTLKDRLKEPLTETTRKVRRNLLASSVVGVVIVKVGLVPNKISAFGIEFSEANQESLLFLIGGAIGFYVITFLVYIVSELTAWSIAMRAEEIELMMKYEDRIHKFQGDMQMAESFSKNVSYLNFISKPVFVLRILVEVLFPTLLAVWAATLVFGG